MRATNGDRLYAQVHCRGLEWDTPYAALVVAILHQAVADAKTGGRAAGGHSMASAEAEHRRCKAEARDWLAHSPNVTTLAELLDLDGAMVRRRLCQQARLKEARV